MKITTLLVIAIVVLASFASASMVPDPTWIAGFYDGADGDEFATLVWERGSATTPDVVTVAPIARLEILTLAPLPPAPWPTTPASVSRAPPA